MLAKSLHFPLIFFAGWIFFSLIQAKDICNYDQDGRNNLALKSISLGSDESIDQTECLRYFEIDMGDPNNASPKKFLIFELIFTNLPNNPNFNPQLVEKSGSRPSVYTSIDQKKEKDFDVADTNGYINRKLYHSIVLEIDPTITSRDKFYFGMYFSDPDSVDSVHYQVKFWDSNTYPCPQDCSGKGKCDQDLKKCVCEPGYFDSDCTVLAKKIKFGEPILQDLAAKTWTYFYYSIGDFSDNLRITLKKNTGLIDYSFLFNEENSFNISNSIRSDGKYRLASQQSQTDLVVEKDDMDSHQGEILIIGAFNDQSEVISGEVLLQIYDSSSLIRTISVYLMLGISIAIFFSWIGISTARYKHHTRMEALLQAYHVERQEEKILTKKDVNKYFPKEKFKDLRSTFSQTMCSVCLEDFDPDSLCRQLYCEHIFHSGCIEAWLVQHYNCPNCKKDMTKQAIEDFIRQKVKREDKNSLVCENKEEKEKTENLVPNSEKVNDVIEVPSQQFQFNQISSQNVEHKKEDENEITYKAQGEIIYEQRGSLSSRLKPQITPSSGVTKISNLAFESNLISSPSKDSLSQDEFHTRIKNLRKTPNQLSRNTLKASNIDSEIHAVKLEG